MAEAFDPLQFLDLAQELARAPRDEASLRTAVGRAYYALFLLAREKASAGDRHNVHRSVIEALKQRSGFRTVGDQLDSLRRLRTAADYETGVIGSGHQVWLDNWTTAARLADRILAALGRW